MSKFFYQNNTTGKTLKCRDFQEARKLTTIEDVKKLKALAGEGLKGMIIGKALYEGKIDLGEAIKVCSQNA